MGRKYALSFDNIASTAQEDLFEIAAATNTVVRIISCVITQNFDEGDAEAEMLSLEWFRATGSGSGGSTMTAQALDPGDAAASFTAERHNTTAATGKTPLLTEAFNVQAGYYHRPTPEEYIVLGGTDIVGLRLNETPADSISLNLAMVVEEIG
jgi:hypothetical protein